MRCAHPSRRCAMKKSLDANPGFLFKFGSERGVDSLRSPCGPPLAVQNAGVLSNPVEASRPSRRCAMQKKAWTRIQAFSLNLAVREGLIRCAHPAGRRWRSKTQAFCRTLSRLLAPLGSAPCKKKPGRESRLSLLNLAVREGFEPSIHFRVYTLSRRAPSATQTPHRFVVDNALRCRRSLM